jgi:surfeit locus 1 family protein
MNKILKYYPTFVIFTAITLLIGLGNWQMSRLASKVDLIDTMSERTHMPELYDISTVNKESLDEFEYRKVKLQGEFLNDKEIHLYAGAREIRGSPGYHILTPFKLDNGQVVIINRGWVPEALKDQDQRKETLLEGRQIVLGTMLAGEKNAFFTPVNDPTHNMWFWIDLDGMKNYTNMELAPFFIVASYNKNIEFPVGRDIVPNFRNDHLQYAIIWYSLAAALLIMYIITYAKKRRNQN